MRSIRVNGLSNQHHSAPLRDFFTQAAMSFCGVAQPPVLSRWLVPQGFSKPPPGVVCFWWVPEVQLP
jgi:hypothetical protein